jgi:hypothetical protein
MKDVSRRVLAILLAVPLFGADQYLFTSFRGNGETGVFLAASSDGHRHGTVVRIADDLARRLRQYDARSTTDAPHAGFLQ